MHESKFRTSLQGSLIFFQSVWEDIVRDMHINIDTEDIAHILGCQETVN